MGTLAVGKDVVKLMFDTEASVASWEMPCAVVFGWEIMAGPVMGRSGGMAFHL